MLESIRLRVRRSRKYAKKEGLLRTIPPQEPSIRGMGVVVRQELRKGKPTSETRVGSRWRGGRHRHGASSRALTRMAWRPYQKVVEEFARVSTRSSRRGASEDAPPQNRLQNDKSKTKGVRRDESGNLARPARRTGR